MLPHSHRITLFLILSLALALRLWLAPMRGHVHDIEQLKLWTETAVLRTPLAVYHESSANYPPLALLPLWGMGHLYRFLSPNFALDSATFTALLKLPAIVTDLATAVLLFSYSRPRWGERWATTVAAAYALTPGIWYNSAWWGQLESLYTLPLLIAICLLIQKRHTWAWVSLTLAVLIKPHAAVLAPILLLVSWRQGGIQTLIQSGLAAFVTATTILLPFLLTGQLLLIWARLQAAAGKQRFLTMNAHNLWYLLSNGRGTFAARALPNPLYDDQPLLGPLTGWQLGLLLLAGWTAWVCWQLWQNPTPARIILASVALVVGFFLLPAESHERYLFPAFALLALLLPQRPFSRWLYILLSLTFFLNLWWVDPAIPSPTFAEVLPWGLPLAALNSLAALILLVALKIDHS